MRDLMREVAAFRDARDWRQFHTPRNLTRAISVEAGELLEVLLWDDDVSGNLDALTDELADVLIYSLSLADVLGIDPAEAVRDKLARNEQRFPVATFKGRAR